MSTVPSFVSGYSAQLLAGLAPSIRAATAQLICAVCAALEVPFASVLWVSASAGTMALGTLAGAIGGSGQAGGQLVVVAALLWIVAVVDLALCLMLVFGFATEKPWSPRVFRLWFFPVNGAKLLLLLLGMFAVGSGEIRVSFGWILGVLLLFAFWILVLLELQRSAGALQQSIQAEQRE
ncbi:MAG TPA: hypothetical protein VNJ11_01665 [Bryobacteraceae bacterium]|nr:hypothetical protein [Bryobacteraceae bacterium]